MPKIFLVIVCKSFEMLDFPGAEPLEDFSRVVPTASGRLGVTVLGR